MLKPITCGGGTRCEFYVLSLLFQVLFRCVKVCPWFGTHNWHQSQNQIWVVKLQFEVFLGCVLCGVHKVFGENPERDWL